MGFPPAEIGRMSMWQFLACADGYARSTDPAAAKRSNDAGGFDDVETLLDAAPDLMN